MKIQDFLDRYYTSINGKNRILTKFRIYSLHRFLVRFLANLILPICFRFNRNSNCISSFRSVKIVVSITSFPNRIDRLWLGIESLLRQSLKPDVIVLWLSKEQIKSKYDLPKKLLSLEERGLEIRLVDGDLRSHKKYYYAMTEFPKDIVITFDDDVFYHSNVVRSLIDKHKQYPKTVCCNNARIILYKEDKLAPYINWKEFINSRSSDDLIQIGIGGVLYPPGVLHKDTLKKELFMELCYMADDIWLNVMARLNNTPIVKSDYFSFYLPIYNSKDISLNSKNLDEGYNDIQINKIRNYYMKNHNIDPYRNKIRIR